MSLWRKKKDEWHGVNMLRENEVEGGEFVIGSEGVCLLE